MTEPPGRRPDTSAWGSREGGNLLGLTVHELAREWRRLIDARLKGLNLSDSRWRVLKSLELLGRPASQKELAEFIGIGGPTLVRLLDSLEADGWLVRRTSCRDRRVKLVELRPKASGLLEKITAVCFEVQHEVLGGIDEQDLAVCHRTLLAILDRTEAMPAGDGPGCENK